MINNEINDYMQMWNSKEIIINNNVYGFTHSRWDDEGLHLKDLKFLRPCNQDRPNREEEEE